MIVPGYTRAVGAYGRYDKNQSELKWFDTNVPAAAIPYGLGTLVTNLALIQSGAGPTSRIGRGCIIKMMEAKINLVAQWVAPTSASGVSVQLPAISYRVDIVLDKQCNGTTATGPDLYDNIVAGTDATNRFFNLYNEGRFTVLKRWEGDINPPSFTTTQTLSGLVQVTRDLVLKPKRCNIPVEYSGATGAITEIRSNNVFIIYSCSQPAGAAGALQGTLNVSTADYRMRFLDS